MPANKPGDVLLEDAILIYRNLQGREGMYNEAGDRNFCVVLPKPLADKMAEDGWAIKVGKPQDEEEEVGDPYIKVKVSYKFRPPVIVMIAGEGGPRTYLKEHSVETIDWANIIKADLVIQSSIWHHGNKSGINAYLQSLYVTIEPDYLAMKYGVYDNPPVSSED